MKHSTIIVGAGIGGLSAAWALRDDPDLLVLDGGDHVGGHSDTAVVRPDGPDGPEVAVDTGFIVHNDLTYPNLVALFEHLDVERAPSDMSFAFTGGPAAGSRGGEAEYSGSLGGLLGHGGWHRRSNLRLTRDIVEFGRVAAAASADGTDHITLAELSARFSPEFRDRYLYPMAAAIWSSPDIDVAAMPARSLIAFFHQHGLFRLRNRPRWSTLAGGSASYVDALVGSLAGEVRHGVSVCSVTRVGDAVLERRPGGARHPRRRLPGLAWRRCNPHRARRSRPVSFQPQSGIPALRSLMDAAPTQPLVGLERLGDAIGGGHGDVLDEPSAAA